METAAHKLAVLHRDLRQARTKTERRSHAGTYLGVGATIRVPSNQGTRLIGIYGSDIQDGVQIALFENGRPIKNAWSTYQSTAKGIVTKHIPTGGDSAITLLRNSREFTRQGISFHERKTSGRITRNEIVFLDDTFRHAISQAAVYQPSADQAAIKILPQRGIRLPVRDFNKRLPDHSNALRLWLEHRDLALPPESHRLSSGLPYSLHQIKGDEYEGGVAASIAGHLHDLANLELYPEGPLIRMHSACSFSEKGRHKAHVDNLEQDTAHYRAFGSTKYPFAVSEEQLNTTCDCRLQMQESQRIIAAHGGIFADFYEQEGRGYGLLNKEEFFYRLFEEEGLNTAEVCERYGINPDIRVYDTFVSWLKSLGIRKVRLLCNNPRKRQALESVGITVKTIGLWLPTEENIDYLRTKRDKLAHDIPPDEELNKYLRDPLRPFRLLISEIH